MRSLLARLLLGAGLGLAGLGAAAQEAPQAPAAPEGRGPGDIPVRAEAFEQIEKGHWLARGPVDLNFSGMRVQADKGEVFELPQPDGSMGYRLVAEGNVVFIRGEERLAGDRLEIDASGRGTFTNAMGFVEPGVFVEGRRIERVDDDTYRVEGGKFTSCSQPNPRWSFSAGSARIEVGDKIVATNALFKVKSVPAFYAPWIYYPIRKDGRSTGFLFPHFGYSSFRGFNVGGGFFWAMGRSYDQTFYVDSYSKVGEGFGHELRYAHQAPSRGTFRTYVFSVKNAPTLDWDIDWSALQMLPGKVRATVQARRYSDLAFQQRFQDNFNLASTRTQRWTAVVERDFKLATLEAYADSATTYFGTDANRVNGHLPAVRLRRFPRQVGFGGLVFGLKASAERFEYGSEEGVDRWSRLDVAPSLSRPLRLSFLEFNPYLGYRYTRYGASYGVDEEGTGGLFGPALDRSFFETSVEMRGPTFSRVFDTPGMGYSERFKHTIGPEVSWTYRTRVEDFNSIPKFDGEDYYLGTNQINYSLVQRFYAKRAGPGGKKVPYEFLIWRLMQTYYVQIADGQSNFDPNYSSSAFGPGFKPEHLSPLMSRIRFRPTREASLDFNLEYDVNFKQFRRHSIIGGIQQPRFRLDGGWTRSVRLSEDPAERIVGAQTLRGALQVDPLMRLHLEGSVDYDLKNDVLWQARGLIRYAVQCCGFSVEMIQYNWNGRDERQWRFRLELANVGSIGNFMGADTNRQGLAGYR